MGLRICDVCLPQDLLIQTGSSHPQKPSRCRLFSSAVSCFWNIEGKRTISPPVLVSSATKTFYTTPESSLYLLFSILLENAPTSESCFSLLKTKQGYHHVAFLCACCELKSLDSKLKRRVVDSVISKTYGDVGYCPRVVVGPLRSPRDRSSALALPHEFPVDSFINRQYHHIHQICTSPRILSQRFHKNSIM